VSYQAQEYRRNFLFKVLFLTSTDAPVAALLQGGHGIRWWWLPLRTTQQTFQNRVSERKKKRKEVG